jgi:hypothetical protein
MSQLIKDLLLCNKYGIKTLYYHNTNDQKDVDMVDKDSEVKKNEELSKEEPEVCDSCVI